MDHSWREQTANTWEAKWERDEDAPSCRHCHKEFGFFRRRHHCRACGRIFCSKCCKNWILLPPNFNNEIPQRCCLSCVKEHGSLDFSRTEDVFGDEHQTTVIMIPGGLTTRNSLVYLAELASKDLRVISMDLPGLGTRRDQRLLMATSVQAIKDTIEKYCQDESAYIFGYGIGGHVAIMFSRHYPNHCKGLILGGCSSEYPPIRGTIFGNLLGAAFKLTPEDERWRIIPDEHPQIKKDRLQRAILRDGVDYKMWPFASDMLKEEREGFYLECLSLVKFPVLIINGEHDYRKSEQRFLEALGENGSVVVIRGADHLVYLDQTYLEEFNLSMVAFVQQAEQNRAY